MMESDEENENKVNITIHKITNKTPRHVSEDELDELEEKWGATRQTVWALHFFLTADYKVTL